MASLNISVDWITLTKQYKMTTSEAHNPNMARVRDVFGTVLEGRPYQLEAVYIPHYVVGMRDRTSGVVVAARVTDTADVIVQFSGTVLAALGDNKSAVLSKLKDDGWKPTRVDVAFDLHEDCASPETVFQAWLDAVPADKRGAYSFWNGAGKGDTLYIGSRQSDTMWRVYDKAAQMGKEGLWVRWEVEIKGGQAKANGWSLIEQPNMASVYLFKRFKDVNLLDLMYMETVLASGEYTLQTPLRPPTDTVRWFQGQVASAFAKLAARDQDAASNILTLYEEIFYKVTAKDNE